MGSGSSIRALSHLLWPHRAALSAGMVCVAMLAATNALHAYITGPLVQLVLTGGVRGGEYLRPLVGWAFPDEPPRITLLMVAVLLVALAAAKGLAHLGQAVLLDGAARRIGHRLRVRLYRHLMRLPLATHRRQATGEMVSRLVDDVRHVEESTVAAAVSVARQGLSALALAAVAVYMAPWLALLAAAAMPLVGLVSGALSRGVKRAAGRGQQQVGRMADRATRGLGAIREVKSCGAEEREVDALTAHSAEATRWAVRRIAVRAFSPLTNEVLASLALGLTLLYAGGRIAAGTLAAERFVSFFVAVILMYRPVKELARAAHLAAAGRASAERVDALLELPAERGAGDEALDPLGKQLALAGVGFSYEEQGRAALAGVDLRLPVGRVVALAGPSGAGKTTLANLVCGLERPDEGSMIWDGEEITSLPLACLREQVALVPQQPLVLDGTVAENLRYGAPDATAAQLQEAVAAAGLEEVVADLDSGLQTMLGPEGVRLSTGEAQRLAVARALLRRVNLLVLDEPSSALDGANERHLVQTLRRVGRDRAVLLIAHSDALLEAADEVVQVEDGRIEGDCSWRGCPQDR